MVGSGVAQSLLPRYGDKRLFYLWFVGIYRLHRLQIKKAIRRKNKKALWYELDTLERGEMVKWSLLEPVEEKCLCSTRG